MGIVYLARELASTRLVAIKLLGAVHAGNAEAALRFAREAETVAALDHPNIVRTLAIEELSGGAVAIVNEYVPGQTLRVLLRESGPLSFQHAAMLLRDVAAALAHAHHVRIVHRDVKPENIFIDAATGRALLADFGIARHLDADTQLTLAGSSLGTPSYMAPEQVKGSELDERADVYSLGLVGWEMLTGVRPWEGETLYDVLHKQQHEQLPSLAALRPDIPAYLLAAIEGALAKAPCERWSNGAEFLTRLTPTPLALPPRPARDHALVEHATIPLRQATAAPLTEPSGSAIAEQDVAHEPDAHEAIVPAIPVPDSVPIDVVAPLHPDIDIRAAADAPGAERAHPFVDATDANANARVTHDVAVVEIARSTAAADVSASGSSASDAAADDATADDAAARDAATHVTATRDGATQLTATHDAAAPDTATHDAATHDAAAHDGATQLTATHDAAAHDTATHDAAAHDAATHDAAAHDAATHDAAAHDAAAHDAATREAPGHDTPAHAVVTHNGGATGDGDVRETVSLAARLPDAASLDLALMVARRQDTDAVPVDVVGSSAFARETSLPQMSNGEAPIIDAVSLAAAVDSAAARFAPPSTATHYAARRGAAAALPPVELDEPVPGTRVPNTAAHDALVPHATAHATVAAPPAAAMRRRRTMRRSLAALGAVVIALAIVLGLEQRSKRETPHVVPVVVHVLPRLDSMPQGPVATADTVIPPVATALPEDERAAPPLPVRTSSQVSRTPARTSAREVPLSAAARDAGKSASTPAISAAIPAEADARCSVPTLEAQRECLIAGIDRNDVPLTRIYHALIAQLRRRAGGATEPLVVRALRREQRAWIDQRDRVCESDAVVATGTLWGAKRLPCFARQSALRDSVLRKRLQRRSGRGG